MWSHKVNKSHTSRTTRNFSALLLLNVVIGLGGGMSDRDKDLLATAKVKFGRAKRAAVTWAEEVLFPLVDRFAVSLVSKEIQGFPRE